MRFATILALIVGVAVCTGASAQDYPARPIKLIVPYSAGGPADVLAAKAALREDVWSAMGAAMNRSRPAGSMK